MPQVWTRTRISPGPTSGTGTSSRRTSFTPRYTTARAVEGIAPLSLSTALSVVSVRAIAIANSSVSPQLEYETEHRNEYVRQRTLGQVLLDLNRPAKTHQSKSDEGASHDQGNSRARRKVHGLPWNCSAPTLWQSPTATGAVPHDTQI